MDDKDAMKQLKALLGIDGALKIVLPFHRCQPGRPTDAEIARDRQMAGDNPRVFGRLARACDEMARGQGQSRRADVRSAHHFEQRDVKRVEGPDAGGFVTAYADDGADNSLVRGKPADVLARLTEHQRD